MNSPDVALVNAHPGVTVLPCPQQILYSSSAYEASFAPESTQIPPTPPANAQPEFDCTSLPPPVTMDKIKAANGHCHTSSMATFLEEIVSYRTPYR